jgi:hypothetical protein
VELKIRRWSGPTAWRTIDDAVLSVTLRNTGPSSWAGLMTPTRMPLKLRFKVVTGCAAYHSRFPSCFWIGVMIASWPAVASQLLPAKDRPPTLAPLEAMT